MIECAPDKKTEDITELIKISEKDGQQAVSARQYPHLKCTLHWDYPQVNGKDGIKEISQTANSSHNMSKQRKHRKR